MHFDLALLKEHPYATGAVVIVGGIVVFYLLSSGSSSSTAASSGNDDYASTLSADEQLSQVQAAADVQTQQTQAQLQQAQLEAQVADSQTNASLQANDVNTAASLAGVLGQISGQVEENNSNNYTAVTEQANNDISQDNVYGMQEAVLEDQINSGVTENANNNATALAGSEDIAGLQTQVSLASLDDATQLASQQQTAYDAQIPYIVQNAGSQQNSALDATDQTSIFQSILSQGNPSVAAAGTNASSSVAVGNNNSTSTLLGAIGKLGASVGGGLFGGG
jgi:hypothetical protein